MQTLLVSLHQAPTPASDSQAQKTKVRRVLQIRIFFAPAAPKHKQHTINDYQKQVFYPSSKFQNRTKNSQPKTWNDTVN